MQGCLLGLLYHLLKLVFGQGAAFKEATCQLIFEQHLSNPPSFAW